MDSEYLGEFYYAFYPPRGLYAETVRFYRDVCGFPVVGPRDANGAAYIECGGGRFEIRNGDQYTMGKTFMLRGAADYQPSRGGLLEIEVEDVDALHQRLQAAGANIIFPPADQPWRSRHFVTNDPSGNVLSFFTRLPGWEQRHAPAAH